MNQNVPATHTSLLRKLLLTLMIIGASGSTIGAGTFASYNATASNAGTFDTGYLVLSNTTPVTNTACFSYGANPTNFTNGNSNTSCDSVFTTGKTNMKPGDTATTANFTLQNKGDISASTMKLYRSACTLGNNGATNGTGDPCDALAITVQEWTNSSFNVAKDCWFPTQTSGACTMSSTQNITDFNVAASPLTVSSSSIAVDESRYFTVTIQLPSTASDRQVQGRSAAFSLTWMLEQ